MEKLTLVNGNDQVINVNIPKLIILQDYINDIALNHIAKNTNLNFKKIGFSYHAQPQTSKQIASLLLTYNFKTQYHNNATTENAVYLKFCTNEGFKVDNICYDCIKRNNIHIKNLKTTDILNVSRGILWKNY